MVELLQVFFRLRLGHGLLDLILHPARSTSSIILCRAVVTVVTVRGDSEVRVIVALAATSTTSTSSMTTTLPPLTLVGTTVLRITLSCDPLLVLRVCPSARGAAIFISECSRDTDK